MDTKIKELREKLDMLWLLSQKGVDTREKYDNAHAQLVVLEDILGTFSEEWHNEE